MHIISINNIIHSDICVLIISFILYDSFILQVSDHGVHKHHWEGYFAQKNAALKSQLPSSTIYTNHVSTTNSNNGSITANNHVKPIFHNLTFYVNGRMELYMGSPDGVVYKEYSAYDIINLIKLHGGICISNAVRKLITHYIASNLSETKFNHEIHKRNNNQSHVKQHIYIVKPQYIIDCINYGKRLSEMKYQLVKDISGTRMSRYITTTGSSNENINHNNDDGVADRLLVDD